MIHGHLSNGAPLLVPCLAAPSRAGAVPAIALYGQRRRRRRLPAPLRALSRLGKNCHFAGGQGWAPKERYLRSLFAVLFMCLIHKKWEYFHSARSSFTFFLKQSSYHNKDISTFFSILFIFFLHQPIYANKDISTHFSPNTFTFE